ncbi:MAG TPA: hypothetical protein K8V56_02030 [Sporosarcina psychrophila]|uniref:Uncharacterized protein n=1 Tax=Sporosarcina psychrophila TaxID=1476 RepID=A0A921FX25_SPOPS|nr:hypothetical protein [Sporosarcina psychrophila]
MTTYSYKTEGNPIKLIPNGDGTYSISTAINNSLFPDKITVEEIKSVENLNKKAYLTQEPSLLTIPTPDGTGSATHPSVLRFRTKWNGYTWWMAFTPYASTAEENPCIVASNDGVTWVVPTGLTNPVFGAPSVGYNSDTDLIYLKNGDKLRMYFREYTAESKKIWHSESTDGVNWSAKVLCIFPEDFTDAISPSIIYTDKYYMYVGSPLAYYESVDGINWSNYTLCNTGIEKFGDVWHPMVWADATKLRMVACVRKKGVNVTSRSSQEDELYYGESVDGVNWEIETNALLRREPGKNFDERVYRASVVPYGSELTIMLSGLTTNLSERIGYSKMRLNT